MGDYPAKLTKTAADHLESGESFVAGAKCVPAGGIKRRAMGGGFGAIGAAVASASRPAGHSIAGADLPSSFAIGLTQRRLFVFSVSTMSGRTSKVHTIVPIEQISAVTGEGSRTVGISQLNVTILFVDGSQLQLEVPRVELAKGRALVDALATATAGNDPPSVRTRADDGGGPYAPPPGPGALPVDPHAGPPSSTPDTSTLPPPPVAG